MTAIVENPARATVLGMELSSPVVVGSGLLTDQERNIRRLLDGGGGAVITKTIHPNPPPGGDERIVRLPTGMLNSTTYSRKSVTEWCDVISRFADEKLPVIANLHADSPRELAELAERVVAAGSPALELGSRASTSPRNWPKPRTALPRTRKPSASG
ncbi:beta/alpha barrel domain-containing protein [Lentzea tibetensis]|uniref:hypothetical protein n=1 Tax=Lentzea tibetensis TaxID=2591470 RepID=UPI001C992F9B|nr:hypothetical protein [Lentzea tibetensis]